jgi:hypothetical protein
MKKKNTSLGRNLSNCFYLISIFAFCSFSGFSQSLGINTTSAPANASAGLDVDFANIGLLIPRVALTSTASFAPFTSHVAGMLIYNTATAADVTPGYYKNDGTKWIVSNLTGNAPGDMQYWFGGAWINIPAGTPGQYLQINPSGVPTWTGVAFPGVTTTAATSITTTTAISGGNITSTGGAPINMFGVCWSTSPNPTTALSTKTIYLSGGLGPFVSNITGLTTATTYYVRAYATNFSGTAYGNQISFITP